MAIGCGAQCSKVMLIVFNIIFWLSGCAILAIGIWLRVDPNMVNLQDVIKLDANDKTLEIGAYVLIGVGAFIFLVGFFGCCGALKESQCMLGTYMACLVIVMGAELAAGILVAVYKPEIEAKLDTVLKDQIQKNYYTGSLIAAGVDWIQLTFGCCGKAGPDDYTGSRFQKNNTNKDPFPRSCCVVNDPENIDYKNPAFKDVNLCMVKTLKYINSYGCYESVLKWIKDHLPIVIGVGVGIACLEIFGFIFACCLCRNVGDKE